MTENPSRVERSCAELRVWPATGWIRALLIAEVIGFLTLFAAYMWFALPPEGGVRPIHVLFGLIAFGLPPLMNRLHGDRLREGGCRLDNLSESLRGILFPLAIVVVGILIVGALADGFPASSPTRLLRNATRYVVWGPIQQYLLCSFILRRLIQAGLSKRTAILTAAILFGFIHGPNPVLAALATGLAVFSCVLFLRHPNVFALGLAHAVFALSVYHVLPIDWHEKLTVGGLYIDRMERRAEGFSGVSEDAQHGLEIDSR